jgi:D-tyrosyl-tRNA(Tyr) deacylase
MRVVVQRVSRALVRVEGEIVGEIAAGLALLLGVGRSDGPADVDRLASKVARMRIFEGENGSFERSLLDTGGGALVVSQFTLLADAGKGTRPSFSDAAPPPQAEPLYDAFAEALRALGVRVETGVFGARMEVELVNDGPVTLVLS